MKQSIKNTLYQAILENKWIEIDYVNRKKEETSFYIGIKDIDAQKDIITCDIFNPFKSETLFNESLKRKDLLILYSGIQKAEVLEQSYYESPKDLIEKIEKSDLLKDYLEIEQFDNNILHYLSDAYQLDNDPYLKDTIMIPGVDLTELAKNKRYELDSEQFAVILEQVFKKDRNDTSRIYRKQDLAINSFSIDINGKQYVVAYHKLGLNFKNKTLVMAEHSTINKTFLIEEKTVTLGTYLDTNPNEFCAEFDARKREFISYIEENFHRNEKVNTRPNIFLIDRQFLKGVDNAFEAITEMDNNNTLSIPLKAFFGRNKSRSGTQKDPNIVVFDRDKINIDQMRVVYNSMVNHVTYVKGPPGTSKTETIFNVLLSAYANDKTVLVCSNNNHPVNDIFEKMTGSLKHKKIFSSEYEDVVFPIMRLGSNKEMTETLKKLKVILEFAKRKASTTLKAEATEKSKEKIMSGYTELREILKDYEDIQEAKEKVEKLMKIKTIQKPELVNIKIDEQIANLNKKIKEMRQIKDSDVTKYAISASKNIDFQNWIYYSSLMRILKLTNATYKDLRDIINNPEEETAVKELNKYIRDDKKLRRFTDIFPIIVCTNISCDKLGAPKPQFDLCIMDESGQCNIATSLIPIVRATDLLLVGDTNQLQPVTVIENETNDFLMEKYNVGKEYDYVSNSILSTMLRKDVNSKSILLSYHYRCGRKIANFVNKRFYEDRLKLFNDRNGKLEYVIVQNSNHSSARNSYIQEARAIVDIVKKYNYNDVGIITPFVNQANLINEELSKEGINNVRAGTVHRLQGSEKPIIILSSALSPTTGKKTMDWVANNHELINVAVTRAKEKFIFVGDKETIDLRSKNDKKVSDLKSLPDYVYSNGEAVVPQSDITISTDFSNNSQNEKDFFETVTPYFNKKGTKFRMSRNIPMKNIIRPYNDDETKLIGQKEFDFVVEATDGFLNRYYRPILVFEIDGGEHVGSSITAQRDREKEQVCKNHGIKVIRIANNQVKDYELIIRLFESIIKDVSDMDSEQIQMSLFDEDN